MPFVITTAKYCFLECDGPGCNRRMEISNVRVLNKVAEACNWENKSDLWLCPNCVAQIREKKEPEETTRKTSKTA